MLSRLFSLLLLLLLLRCCFFCWWLCRRCVCVFCCSLLPKTQTISVEWHHVIPWRLATGSHDRTVRIWDVDERAGTRWDRTASQRQKPAVMEQTLKPTLILTSPAPVRGRWLLLLLLLVCRYGRRCWCVASVDVGRL